MEIHNRMGSKFLEKVYENSLMVLFRREEISAEQQVPISVFFEGEKVGYYVADILVEDKIILEIKCCRLIADGHRAQTINYLKATGKNLAIILNFGNERLEYERIVQ
jgi:GxxExxY protein